jgi:hypothetical protein
MRLQDLKFEQHKTNTGDRMSWDVAYVGEMMIFRRRPENRSEWTGEYIIYPKGWSNGKERIPPTRKGRFLTALEAECFLHELTKGIRSCG